MPTSEQIKYLEDRLNKLSAKREHAINVYIIPIEIEITEAEQQLEDLKAQLNDEKE